MTAMNLPPFSQPKLNLVLIENTLSRRNSMVVDAIDYFPEGGLLYIWDDIKQRALSLIDQRDRNDYRVELNRNLEGFPTATFWKKGNRHPVAKLYVTKKSPEVSVDDEAYESVPNMI